MTVSASGKIALQPAFWYRFWCRKPGKAPFTIQAARLLGRAIGASLFAITPAGERGMCRKAIKLGNAGVFPSHDVVIRRPVNP